MKLSDVKLKLPRKTGQKKLPEVLGMEETLKLIEAPDNLKHRVLLKTTYSAGLRVREVIALKPEHIDSSRMLVRVVSGKGRKDRETLLSRKLLKGVALLLQGVPSRDLAVLGQKPGETHMRFHSPTSIQECEGQGEN